MAKPLTMFCFIFALVSIAEIFVEADVCKRNIGPCDANCNPNCVAKYPKGGSGACSSDGYCFCFFECGTEKRCNVGLGRCSAQCNAACCQANCAAKGPLAVGICDGPTMATQLCNCSYDCS